MLPQSRMYVAMTFIAFLGTCMPQPTRADTCRQGAASATRHCALPDTLGNFQGYYLCDEQVKIGKPETKADLVALTGHYSHVKGVGVGHSWWAEQFCSGNTSDSINIVTTELQTTLSLINNPVYYNASYPASAEYPLQIDETRRTVSAASGVPQRILLDSLAMYKSELAPNGYTIAAFPWYIDQSIGGAVSTGTHGSSFQHGSISSQTVRIEMALANGTLANFTAASNPVLWRAVQISVGRLGVITEVELSIIPQDMVERVTYETDFQAFVDRMKDLQEAFLDAVNGTGPNSVADVLSEYEATQEAAEALQSVDEATIQTASISTQPPALAPQPQASLLDDPLQLAPGPYLEDVFAQSPSKPLGKVPLPATNPLAWNSIQYGFLKGFLTNGTFLRRDSILAETAFVNQATSDTDPYDQYEFSVKIENIGTCAQKIQAALEEDSFALGFPVPPLIRFVGEEGAFLSNTNGGPRVFFNIEDHQSYQTGEPNTKFDSLVGVLRGEGCWARMHWGKAGWQKWAPCFDGSIEYSESWCDFGCAVQGLDPSNKFASRSSVWTWTTEKNGTMVDYNQCCTGEGFDPMCTCSRRADC